MSTVKELIFAPGGAIGKLASKINEIIRAMKPLRAGKNVKITEANENILISFENTSGGGELPVGEDENDILRWDGNAWVVLPAPSTAGIWVLGVESGVMKWIDTTGC